MFFWLGMRKIVSKFSSRLRFIRAIWNSYSKSETARSRADHGVALLLADEVDEEPFEGFHLDARM